MDKKAPLELRQGVVRPEWLDYNGHMNVAYYVLAFDHACDSFLDHIGMTDTFRARPGGTTFAAEMHITYQREVVAGGPLRFTSHLLGFDKKRIHFILHMYHAQQGYLAATSEWLSLYVDLASRRVAAMPEEISSRLAAIYATHKEMPRPPEAGRTMSLGSKGG
jgi:acyl-CoA thioester hydrolase